MKKIENKTFIFCCFILLYLSYSNGVSNILTWDIFGHYSYLPMQFHKHQLIHTNLSYFKSINETYKCSDTLYQFGLQKNGNYIPRPTMGWAIILSPFYFIAKIITPFTQYKNDGFSIPYQYALSFGASIYMILGIYYCKKILRLYFNPVITSFTLIALILGTNFLYMNYAAKGSSNNLIFSLIAFMIWQNIQFHKNYQLKNAIGLGLAIGLIGIVRPPDITLALIPMFWSYKKYGGIYEKVKYFYYHQKWKVIVVFSITLFLLSIQFFFWKITTGHFIVNSYGDNSGEGFDWLQPYTLDVLFSFRKGWFIYTPIMILSVIGLFIWRKKNPTNGIVIILVFLLFLYIISSWTTWWYATSFSQRALIDIYPLLIIGLGFYIQFIIEEKKKLLIGIIILLIGLNLFQTYQIDRGIIDGSRMTKEYYFSTFFQVNPPTKKQKELLIIDRINKYYSGFDDSEKYKICFQKKYTFSPKTKISKKTIFSPPIDLLPSDVSKKDHFWIRIIYNYIGEEKSIEGKFFTAAVLYNKNGQGYGYVAFTKNDKLLKINVDKKEIVQEYLSPEFRTEKDKIRVCSYYQQGNDLEISSVKIVAFEKK